MSEELEENKTETPEMLEYASRLLHLNRGKTTSTGSHSTET